MTPSSLQQPPIARFVCCLPTWKVKAIRSRSASKSRRWAAGGSQKCMRPASVLAVVAGSTITGIALVHATDWIDATSARRTPRVGQGGVGKRVSPLTKACHAEAFRLSEMATPSNSPSLRRAVPNRSARTNRSRPKISSVAYPCYRMVLRRPAAAIANSVLRFVTLRSVATSSATSTIVRSVRSCGHNTRSAKTVCVCKLNSLHSDHARITKPNCGSPTPTVTRSGQGSRPAPMEKLSRTVTFTVDDWDATASKRYQGSISVAKQAIRLGGTGPSRANRGQPLKLGCFSCDNGYLFPIPAMGPRFCDRIRTWCFLLAIKSTKVPS